MIKIIFLTTGLVFISHIALAQEAGQPVEETTTLQETTPAAPDSVDSTDIETNTETNIQNSDQEDDENADVVLEFSDTDIEQQMSDATIQRLEQLKAQGFDFNATDSAGNSVLYYLLTRNPDLEVAKKAIEYGADVNKPVANGMIPLNIATSKANELQLQVMMFQTLGMDLTDEKNQKELQKNLFHEMSRAIEMTDMLIKAGANVNLMSSLGSPLMNAATNAWNLEIADMLIKAGAKVDQKDKNGRTALFYAFSGGNDDMMTLLLKYGADPEIKDNSGKFYFDVEKFTPAKTN